MKPVILIAAAAALLLLNKPARAATVGAVTVPNGIAAGQRQDYANPIAVAATQAAAVLQTLVGIKATPTAGDAGRVAAAELARAAVRAGDSYYWNTTGDDARAAVRAGDSYYSSDPWQAAATGASADVPSDYGIEVAALMFGGDW